MREDGSLDGEFSDRTQPRQQHQQIRLRMREDGILEEDLSPRVRESSSFDRRMAVPVTMAPVVRSYDVGRGNSMEVNASEIGFQGNRYNEEGLKVNHYAGSKGKRKWVITGKDFGEDGGSKENRYLGNKGKRWKFNQGSSQYNNERGSSKRFNGQKPSALGRIQSGISVWNRIEEKPSPPSEFSNLGFLEESQPEIDSIDLSYKSNALVAKVVAPSSPEPQPSVEGTSPRLLTPKNRMKMKKVDKDRTPIISSLIVSRTGDGVPNNLVSSRSQVSNSVEGSKIVKASSSKPASDKSKKKISSSGKCARDVIKSATNGLKKAKLVGDASKKAISSSSKPASDGSKKFIGSSCKPAGSARSQTLSKKVAKVASVKRAVAKKPAKAMIKNVSEDCRQEDKVSDSKSTDCTNSQLVQPGLAVITTSVENSAPQQSSIDKFVYWPMEVAPTNENCAAEQYAKDDTSVHGPMIVTSSIETSIAVRPSTYANFVPGPMLIASEKTASKQSVKDGCCLQASMVERTTSVNYPMELCGKDVNLVQESIVTTSSVENTSIEQSSKDFNLKWNNIANDTVKEEAITPVESTVPDSTCPVVSGTRVVIDISSDSSPEMVTDIRSPSKSISAEELNAGDCRKETDAGNASESDAKLGISSFTECSSFRLAGDAQTLPEITMPIVTSPIFCSPYDENVKRKREEIDKQHQLEVSSVSNELEILAEQMNENSEVRPSDASSLVQDKNPPSGATIAEDNDLRLSRAPSVSDNTPFLEERSVNVVMTERVEQLLPLSPSENCALIDAKRAQHASTFTMEEQYNPQLSDSICCSGNNIIANKQDDKPIVNDDSLVFSKKLLELDAEQDSTSDKAQFVESHEPKKCINADVKLTGVTTSTKFILSSGVPRVFTNQLSSTGPSKETARSSRSVRNKTWHRIDAPSSSALPIHGNLQNMGGIDKQSAKKQSPKKLGRVPNSSYVRKGFKLIRKPVTVASSPILPHRFDASSRKSHLAERSMTFGSMDNISNRKACLNPTLERPKTPPLSLGFKVPSYTLDTQKESHQLLSEDPVSEPSVEAEAKPDEGQKFDMLSDSVHNLSIANGMKSEPLTKKRMSYVKHKSNQLVAAPQSDFGDSSTHQMEKTEKLSTSTGHYYMRKKNQLILNASSSDSQHKQDGTAPVHNSNSDGQDASNVFSLECCRTDPFRKRLDRVLRKRHKHSKFSRVWTLGGQSDKQRVTSRSCWEVMPYLFPWKRSPYCKFSKNKSVLNSNRGSLSLISRKLQLTRKRDTIYTVSTDGFSLRKAGVVSIGGSSLKWSKSIDRHSKKANEEATLAVAEEERKRRERKRKKPMGSRGKHSFTRKSTSDIELQQGERIFRVGSVRYKMDASKLTLITIQDDQSPGADDKQIQKNTFVPRRLLIGNNEYVRVGNGNRLVRDPKKLIRMLASEKIRWSLHTARRRLAKKQQYCQFFTRFGKCNKNSGKCTYIHDPEKVAICTKFLRGVCTDANCKLTHQIIPERMPDCSYFLQGLCTNISCSYRHVYVNPKASVCDGFLRGYCADGDECRKKHSYVCPLFEATGICPQGSKCKLHHPKSRKKSKKRKHSEIQNSSRGRYFSSKIVKFSEPMVIASDKCNEEKGADQFAEFISIDVNSDNGDDIETNVSKDSNSKESDSDLSDRHPDELDALVKPMRIMNMVNLQTPFNTC
ncbi:uncharacterized protein A4U43_C05F32320 [Asparagus officinalis]|uniref:C3H1-type domain-containing protein n=1 Tax=Asparagus officinalis TaxID=4686 RepID=A0A5P1F0Q6_ASPOF|nr:uncharacterized protein LOC109841104 [Asparagus officinalis]ONK70301.1 uncharacterized protein A4U43_C05F32320 [Asparagus officinalis]